MSNLEQGPNKPQSSSNSYNNALDDKIFSITQTNPPKNDDYVQIDLINTINNDNKCVISSVIEGLAFQTLVDTGATTNNYMTKRAYDLCTKKRESIRTDNTIHQAANGTTFKDVYPLPRIDESLAALQKGKYFTTLDLAAGYHQIPMQIESIEKTAFITEGGLFEFLAMPFGLTNAPATFQRYMDAILAGLKWKNLLCYLDDIIIFSPTYEEHMDDLIEVFDRIRAANLQLNDRKCHFFKNRLNYLGHVVSADGIEADPVKIKAILELKTPSNSSEVHTLLGGCGYYRKFIPNFAKICSPLYKLIHVGEKFRWSKDEEEALDKIKKALTSPPILAHPDFKYPFQLHTDASDYGLGCTLTQEVDGIEKVILYMSRSLQPAEKKWCVREKEALAILWACESLRHFLIGYKFTILTDHHSLQWLKEAKSPARLVRWALRLSEFDFEIKYKPGIMNCDADMLSRLPIEAEVNNQSSEYEPEHQLFQISTNYLIEHFSVDRIKQSQEADPTFTDLLLECNNNEGTSLNGSFVVKNQILYKINSNSELLMVPHDLREPVLKHYHTHILSVHLARDRLYELLRSRFYWNGMYKYVQEYVRNCELCQKIKTRAPINAGKLQPIPVNRPFQLVGTDIVIMRITTGGYRYILVCIDYLTNWVEAEPLKTMTTEEVIRVFFKIIISRHGCPEGIISDSGTQFCSKAFHKLCDTFNIKKIESTPYHQQANGKCERFVGYLKKALALITPQEKLHKWNEMIDHCLFSYRITVSRVLNDSPFFLLYGRDPLLPQDLSFSLHNRKKRGLNGKDTEGNYQFNLAQKMKTAYHNLMKRKAQEQEKYKTYYDSSHYRIEYNIGDRVLILFDTPNKNSLMPRWEGPFVILNKIDDVTYRVSNQDKIIAVHVQRMCVFRQKN